MEPLNAPRRAAPPPRHADHSAIWWIVAIGLCLVAAIAYEHLGPGFEDRSAEATSLSELQAGAGGAGLGERREMKEEPLQMAPALPTERFAGAVSHVQDSAACKGLRAQKDRVQQSMKKAHSSAEAKELQLDLKSIRNRGAELGCWSGGAG